MKEKVNSFKHLKKLLGERNAISFYHICHNPLLIIARKLKTNKFQSLKKSFRRVVLLSLKNHLDFGLFIVFFLAFLYVLHTTRVESQFFDSNQRIFDSTFE